MYGCQRHMVDLPKPKIVTTENEAPEGAKMAAAAAAGGVKVKSEKKKGLQKVKHESKPQDDSPSLSPCPPNGASSDGAGIEVQQPPVATKMEPPSYRAGFLLGDGAGMVSFLSRESLNVLLCFFQKSNILLTLIYSGKR